MFNSFLTFGYEKSPRCVTHQGLKEFILLFYENTANVRTRLHVNHPLNVPDTESCRGRS